MIRFLLFCILAQNAMPTNITSKEVDEAYKYFESIHDKLNAVKKSVSVKKVVPRTRNNLLAVLHNLQQLPIVADIRPLDVTQPLLESKEQSQEVPHNEGYKLSTSAGSYIYKDDHLPTDGKEDNEEMDRRKFLETLDNLLQDKLTTTTKKPTTTQHLKKKDDKRRMFEWISNLFGKGTTVSSTEPTSTTIGVLPRVGSNDNINSIDNITEILVKLNNVFEKLNQNIEDDRLRANKSDAFFVLKLPLKPKPSTDDVSFRRKREIKATDYIARNHTRTNKVNDTLTHDRKLTVVETTTNSILAENSFKFKILAHLIDSFNEIKYKIAPLAKVKELHSSNDLYKIGYIAASIDTLEENLNKFMEELNKNKNVWNEKKILEFFDKIKTSNHVLRTLMEYLERLTEQKQVYDANDLEK